MRGRLTTVDQGMFALAKGRAWRYCATVQGQAGEYGRGVERVNLEGFNCMDTHPTT